MDILFRNYIKDRLAGKPTKRIEYTDNYLNSHLYDRYNYCDIREKDINVETLREWNSVKVEEFDNCLLFDVNYEYKGLVTNVPNNLPRAKADRIILVTHGNCNDGLGCRLVMEANEIKYDLLEAHHGTTKIEDVLELVRSKNVSTTVYITDFSFSTNDLITLSKEVDTVVMIDHHQSALVEVLKDREILDQHGIYYYMDMALSGTVLFEEFLGVDHSELSYLIQDRDLFYKFLDNTEEAAMLLKTETDISVLKLGYSSRIALTRQLDNYSGAVILMKKKAESDAMHYDTVHIGDTLFAFVNNPTYISDTLNIISAKTGMPALSYKIELGDVYFAMRGYDDSVDLSRIAKSFGGGGHKQAAGFKLSLLDFHIEEFLHGRRLLLTTENVEQLLLGVDDE